MSITNEIRSECENSRIPHSVAVYMGQEMESDRSVGELSPIDSRSTRNLEVIRDGRACRDYKCQSCKSCLYPLAEM